MLSKVIVVSFVVVAYASVADIDLASFAPGPSTGYKIIGPHTDSFVGGYVTGAGDFNGDGLKDVAISGLAAIGFDRYDSGITYIIFGSRTFSSSAVDAASFTSGSAGIRIIGVTGAQSGNYLGGGMDFNKDGYDDVLIGSHWSDPGGLSDAGTVHVVFGHGPPYTDTDLGSLSGSQGFQISGAAAGDWMYNCAFVGDMNGDHYADIVVGAQFANPVSTRDGIAYVIFGSTSTSNINLATYTFGTNLGFKLIGSGFNNQLGQYLGTAGGRLRRRRRSIHGRSIQLRSLRPQQCDKLPQHQSGQLDDQQHRGLQDHRTRQFQPAAPGTRSRHEQRWD
jgi:hypothetical protein